MRFRSLLVGGALALAAATGVAAAPDPSEWANKAATVFSPQHFTADDSSLNEACGRVLLFFQALSAVVIVAGLIARIQQEKTQLEGVAATLLKVAFIAVVPALRDTVLNTTALIAESAGYQSVNGEGAPPPVMTELWALVGEWAPPGSPYLDALTSQSATNAPAAGSEQAWGLEAWNWARGVGAADASLFHGLWQAASGSLRAVIVFGSCAVMVCCLSVTIMLACLSEILRYLLFTGGCALVPLFIAGLSVEALRPASLKFILGLFTIALWPIGWALANIVTHFAAVEAHGWIKGVTQTALDAVHLPAAPLAVAAPYVGWGTLFVFVGLTLVVCAWTVASLFYTPVLLGRAMSASAGLARAAWEAMPASFSAPARGNGAPAGLPPRAPVANAPLPRPVPILPMAARQAWTLQAPRAAPWASSPFRFPPPPQARSGLKRPDAS